MTTNHHRALAPADFSDTELLIAPWMEVALGELGKGVHEIRGDTNFSDQFYRSLSEHNPRYSLLDWHKIDHDIADKMGDNLGSVLMEESNPEVMKYLKSTRLETFTKRTTTAKHPGEHEWRMQAWCAAFVNWCLKSVNIKPLGSASAAVWMRFGMPVLNPPRGAITVLKPSKAWEVKGGSGHVAFYGGAEGDKLWLLGGNQNHGRVTWTRHDKGSLRGFRWPRVLGDFPTTNSSIA